MKSHLLRIVIIIRIQIFKQILTFGGNVSTIIIVMIIILIGFLIIFKITIFFELINMSIGTSSFLSIIFILEIVWVMFILIFGLFIIVWAFINPRFPLIVRFILGFFFSEILFIFLIVGRFSEFFFLPLRFLLFIFIFIELIIGVIFRFFPFIWFKLFYEH